MANSPTAVPIPPMARFHGPHGSGNWNASSALRMMWEASTIR